MGMQPVVIEQFPGLDLRADPGEGRYAIDAMNVTLEEGRVRSRDGLTNLVSTAGAPLYAATYNLSSPHLIVASATADTLYAFTTGGSTAGSSTLPGIGVALNATGAAIGTAAANYFYVVSSGGSVVKRWDGGLWASPAGFPSTIYALTTSPTDNRLVVCSAGSKVSFSDPGAPETFGASNYVLLAPGDGEEVRGGVVFGNNTFIFKNTKFFVFYGTSTGSAGQPVFNYHTVDTGIGMGSVANQSVCVAPNGVYFLATDGIYFTKGGPPVKVSQALDNWFRGDPLPFWSAAGWTPATSFAARLTWADGKLYFATGVGLVFVLDLGSGAWTAWLMNAKALAAFPGTLLGSVKKLVVGVGANVLRVDPAATTDNGSVIVSRYRSAFNDFGSPEVKRLRETIVEGTGSVTLRWSHDWRNTSTSAGVTMGTAPAIGIGRSRAAHRGRWLSYQAEAGSGAWSINRLTAVFSQPPRAATVTGV